MAAAAVVVALTLTGTSGAASARAKGIDVSNNNGPINWTKVAGAGYAFAFGKATEGTTFTDGTYSTNRNGSESAGLTFGAYHFARPAGGGAASATASAIAQADYFLSVANPQPGELPPVLDLEKTGKLPPKRLVIWTQAWVDEVFARIGVEPFIYSSPAFWQSYLGDTTSIAASGALLWIAHWTSASTPWVPAQNWNGAGWTFWQWTDCLSVPGIAHCTDGDRMNGVDPSTVTIQSYDTTDPPVLSTPPSIVGPPEAGMLLAAVPGTWSGGKPLTFTYAWRRCDAAGANCVAIPGATGEKYTPVTADVGHSLEVAVTATAATGSATELAPATVAVSPAGTPPSQRPANLSSPKILGKKQAGQVLASSVGTWSGSPTKFAYRWQRCDATGANCVAIKKATTASYTVTPDDIGAALALVVTATGAGGAASASTAPTDVVVAAPLPPVSTGSQTVAQGVAGNVQTDGGNAVATWQPGAVPVGLTVSLATFAGTLTVPGSEVSLTVPGLPSKGFSWPVDVAYTIPQQPGTVLGYSTDGKVYATVPVLNPPQLPAGQQIGRYLDTNSLTHVLTRAPLDLALFTAGAWGDPTYTSPNGPALSQKKPLEALFRRSDKSVLVLTRVSALSQTRLTATITGAGGKKIGILPNGSRLGAPLTGTRVTHAAQVERDLPGSIVVRLRLNGRRLAAGKYTLRIGAVDPWGRTSTLTLPFTYAGPA
ncbi:MAG TPA: glycoside hydrolase family 25 protein [Gaiellaceae bacterium]|nr:glycoside hydrolase family 25 protein [Gaiellaceae bacterium]